MSCSIESLCLERIKDLFTEIRYAEGQSVTVISISLLIAAALASAFAYFHPHPDALPEPVRLHVMVAASLGFGVPAFLLNDGYRRRALAAHQKLEEFKAYLAEKGDLPADMPSLSFGIVAPGWNWSLFKLRGRKLVWNRAMPPRWDRAYNFLMIEVFSVTMICFSINVLSHSPELGLSLFGAWVWWVCFRK